MIEGQEQSLNPEIRIAELEARVRELEKRNAELERLSYCDSLTGLYNRRFFDESLYKLIVGGNESPVLDERRAGTDNREVGVIVVDADQFKHINDTYGHAAGDEVLKSVSRALVTLNKREADIVARTGGDEFVILLPGMSEEMAAERARNLWSIIREFKVRAGVDLIPITISLGVGSLKLTGVKDALYAEEIRLKGSDLPPDEINAKLEEKKKEIFAEFLDQVDEAMYAVKKEKGSDQIARVSEIQNKEIPSDEAA